ncbi:MAG TPA: CHASE domain-containing protein [Patescibacteria group bacterium]|nr:CHASE domain-containing protein [Patescibacteria group bacterium]
MRQIYKSLFFPPFVIFLAMSCVTYWSWRASSSSLDRDIHTVTTAREAAAQDIIKQRLNTFEQILLGGAGLFRGSDNVTQNEWQEYVATFHLQARSQEVAGLGYTQAISADEVPTLTQSFQEQNVDNFTIHPSTSNTTLTPITRLDPYLPDRLGLDMSSDPIRRSVLEHSRDTGQAALTPPVSQIQPADKPSVPVFLLFVPQYRDNVPADSTAERRAALQGYVYAGFYTDDFFANLFHKTANDHDIAFQISADNSGQEQVFYETPNYAQLTQQRDRQSDTRAVDFYGQRWLIHYAFGIDTLVSEQRRATPVWTWIIGLMLAFLLADVIYLLLKARASELALQKEMDIDVAKDELLSLASHQLRTPATTVKQYLGMVLQGFAGTVPKNQIALLEKAYDGNERQLYIINEMLHVAKVDAGRITLAKTETDLVALVEEVVSEQQQDLESVGHSLKMHLPKRPMLLSVDAHMLRMALENLLSNAIKYTPPGGKLVVSLRRKKTHVEISVQDNGIGIEAEDFPKLYKLFTRLDNKLTQTISGTGVGLYLAKHLIELHHGHLRVASIPGKGSTFTITLPDASRKS